jgi:hypothetical protein
MFGDRKPYIHMLIFRRLVRWVIERVIELVLGTIAVILTFGSSNYQTNSISVKEIIDCCYFVIAFFVVSGYIFTSMVISIVFSVRHLWRHIWSNVFLFSFHASLFLFIIVRSSVLRDLLLIIIGACIVSLTAIVGKYFDSTNETSE